MSQRMFSKLSRWAVVAAILLPSFGQVTTSTFYGTVTDPSGAVVVGAVVTLTNQGTGTVAGKTAGQNSDFVFDFVPVGTYRLRIEAAGFKSLVTGDMDLQAGSNVRRTLGAVTDAISVEGTAPMVNVVSAEQSQEVTSKEAEELPLAKRNLGNLLGDHVHVSSQRLPVFRRHEARLQPLLRGSGRKSRVHELGRPAAERRGPTS